MLIDPLIIVGKLALKVQCLNLNDFKYKISIREIRQCAKIYTNSEIFHKQRDRPAFKSKIRFYLLMENLRELQFLIL